MKIKYDLHHILPPLLFMMILHHDFLLGQTLDSKPGPIFMRTPKTIDFMVIAKTSDALYTNDSTYFLMDRSPLEKFPDYKKLYDDKVEPYGHARWVTGAIIPPEETSRYKVDWYLNDSSLYLSDIDFNVSSHKREDIFLDNEQYKRMEELTGIKFDTVYENHTHYIKDAPSVRQKLFNPLGAMPAIWFSDTIIVKRAMNEKNYREWYKEPCRELIFKNGKLISERIKEGMY